MTEAKPSLRSAIAIRLAALIVCTVGQIVADASALGIGSACIFVVSTLLFAMIGLKWSQFRPMLSAAPMGAKEYSCRRAVGGSFFGAAAALLILDKLPLWEHVCVPFVLGSLGYYLAGKLSCIELRCCESTAPDRGLRLPVLEVLLCALILAAGMFLTVIQVSPLLILTFTASMFASLRLLSRLRRGHGVAHSFATIDVGGIFAISIAASLLAGA